MDRKKTKMNKHAISFLVAAAAGGASYLQSQDMIHNTKLRLIFSIVVGLATLRGMYGIANGAEADQRHVKNQKIEEQEPIFKNAHPQSHKLN